ncbi:protein of unknown function DUF395 YeeE/YedE [Caldithrix abyssi DSM 13497]|uniref:Uncharacterized protein n=1 Tax=Caldithrix abyssi DSM 13497 TaxID=880073 RepID=H1XYZ0_CALAY|nr:YeeE/YedE thiosulfate transporter family protein [Caldithrix abyssi]APF18014.1 hypothetical protein Cabys_1265 [Caldithrix abyssi DSM 13497]EHO42061.1 protein of unknown function DUF395 YeeE/YedE [Caldithrix abyssi DSM 13497]
MAPFYKFGYFGTETSFVIALLLGIGFGFWLERAGFGESRKLALQFYFKDMTVLKVMFSAILTAMIGLLYLTLFGWLDLSKVYVNPTYLGAQIFGGLVFGMGFAIGGYCPGTSVVGAVLGRIDAYFFLGGILFGMLVFGEMFPLIEGLYNSGFMDAAKVSDWLNIPTGLTAFFVILMALVMFLGAEWLETKFRKEPQQ